MDYYNVDFRKYDNIYDGNELIGIAVAAYYQTKNPKELFFVLRTLKERMDEGGQVPTPMIDVNNVVAGMDINSMLNMKPGQTFTLDREVRLRKETVTDLKGDEWFPLFTTEREMYGKVYAPIVTNTPIRQIVEDGYTSERVKGIVINPFGESMSLPKKLLELIVGKNKQ